MQCDIKNNSNRELPELISLLKSFLPFAQERMGFHKPPVINFNSNQENAQNPLGKTAYYDPTNHNIVVYVDGRHVKDILRSISHELVHHSQNLRGDFGGREIKTEEGYAQKDDFLREMEREAYEKGNLCFRDWEDNVKTTNYNDRRNGDMSLQEWKNNLIFKKVMKRFNLVEGGPNHHAGDWFSELESDEYTDEETEETEDEMGQVPPQSADNREEHEGEKKEVYEMNQLKKSIQETITNFLKEEEIYNNFNKLAEEQGENITAKSEMEKLVQSGFSEEEAKQILQQLANPSQSKLEETPVEDIEGVDETEPYMHDSSYSEELPVDDTDVEFAGPEIPGVDELPTNVLEPISADDGGSNFELDQQIPDMPYPEESDFDYAPYKRDDQHEVATTREGRDKQNLSEWWNSSVYESLKRKWTK